MKKLFLIVALVATTFSANAVDKLWDMGTMGLGATGLLVNTTVDYLTMVPGDAITTFGILSTGTTAFSVSDGITFTGSLKTGGSGYTAGGDSILPQKRYLKFTTTAASYIKVYFKSGTTGTYKWIMISDGTSLLARVVTNETPVMATATTSGPGTVYIYAGVSSCTIYGVSATNVATDVKEAISTSLLSKVGEELVNPTNLEVEIYSVMGVKVLTSSASSISISGLASGVYVAKTEEGTLKFIN